MWTYTNELINEFEKENRLIKNEAFLNCAAFLPPVFNLWMKPLSVHRSYICAELWGEVRKADEAQRWALLRAQHHLLLLCHVREQNIHLSQMSGTHTHSYQCGSGSVDPCLWLMDPDPDSAILIIDLQDANKKLIKKKTVFLLITSTYYIIFH